MDFINIDHLVRGAIDMHMHPGPGGLCRLDAIEAAEQARQAGMKAIVLKSHSYTAAVAVMVSKLVEGVQVFGSICLDYEIGGLNLNAVENAARLGAKVVWIVLILVLPVAGVIVWLFAGPRGRGAGI